MLTDVDNYVVMKIFIYVDFDMSIVYEDWNTLSEKVTDKFWERKANMLSRINF
jgi:hypothetical protein